MKLQFSVAARDRKFSKAMRRIDPKFKPLTDAFESVELRHPIHEAILVLITDDKGPEVLEEVENNDGFFQVLAGCSFQGSDEELADDVFSILQRAVRLCPFATPDHKTFDELFERLSPNFSSGFVSRGQDLS